MGYTTKFTGCINLSRALTLKEAKELLEIANLDRAEARKITGTDAYLQWVPTETLDGIVWDGNEKFYEYVPLLRWLCGWLKERGIEANGELLWAGDETDDRGRIAVSSNEVEVIEGQRIETGTRIARSGNTGNSTGPHLHFVVQRNVGLAIESIPFDFSQPVNSLPNFAVGGE